MRKLQTAAIAGLFSAAAIGFVAVPMTSGGALAAAKKGTAMKKGAMKGGAMKKGAMKGGAMKSGAMKGSGKGGGDPLNAAAGKKM